MNRPHRSIEIFTMSALDLFVTAMGSFAILMMILFPYFHGDLMEPVKNTPGNVLFCVWTVRVKDFEQFVKEVPDPKERGEDVKSNLVLKDDAWRNPGYEQEPDYPVVGVSLLQANAFCRWLTKKERAAGIIGPHHEYRLPTDDEWTAAAGPSLYPWGKKWPPPANSGNFGDETHARELGWKSAALGMQGYTDRHWMVAPVGSYAPNRFGLYDMAGNVTQWCFDRYYPERMPAEFLAKNSGETKTQGDDGTPFYVRRGSAWNHDDKDSLASWRRRASVEKFRLDTIGFRCVLVVGPPPAQ
jgi:formylglycine-generating enzyme required for sulfatase activity